jgi:hypothetical protein
MSFPGNPPVEGSDILSPEWPAEWPAEVDLILSAMDVGDQHDNRRKHLRMPYRVIADLRLFSDPGGIAPWRLYIRDTSARGLGFVTPHRLPLGYGGVVQLLSPAGRVVSVNGTLFRCREIGNDWYEGAMYFNREQWMFAPVEMA